MNGVVFVTPSSLSPAPAASGVYRIRDVPPGATGSGPGPTDSRGRAT